jgi:hypothetical protein
LCTTTDTDDADDTDTDDTDKPAADPVNRAATL